jgi:hypothetical protein
LGLSIVRQIIETNGGKIEVNSEPSIGTKLTVKLALTKPEAPDTSPLSIIATQRSQFLSYISRLEGRNICILQRPIDLPPGESSMRPIVEGLARFTNTLSTTLQKHLKMDVVRTTEWKGHDADIVIVPELSFDYLASIRRSRINGERAPVTIFVAMDAMEAATLRSDARIRNKESVVEVMTQPYVFTNSSWCFLLMCQRCGPLKLAYILNHCLDRYDLPDENLRHHSSSDESARCRHSSRSGRQAPSPRLDRSRNSESSISDTVNPVATSDASAPASSNPTPPIMDKSASQVAQVLIVDDNSINRSVSRG